MNEPEEQMELFEDYEDYDDFAFDDDYVHDVYLIESDAEALASAGFGTEEEEPIPTWGEVIRDPESMFVLFSLILVVALMIFW